MKVEKIDHVVITVKDLNKTIDFYTNALGMKLEKFSSSLDNNQIRYAVSFGSQKINIHEEKNLSNPMHCICLLYTSPSPRDLSTSRMPSSA